MKEWFKINQKNYYEFLVYTTLLYKLRSFSFFTYPLFLLKMLKDILPSIGEKSKEPAQLPSILINVS